MNTHAVYLPSRLLPGETEMIRKHSFTRWMSSDLLQASTDFCRNIGLVSIYSECSSERQFRCLLWRPPQETVFEIRSGRSRRQFEEFDQRNREKGRPLLTLHLNELDIYSAVWISAAHHEPAAKFLAAHGILPAERKTVSS